MLFHASLLNTEPTIDEAIAPTIALSAKGVNTSIPSLLAIEIASVPRDQFCDHTSPSNPIKNPIATRPNKAMSFVPVKIFCKIFPPLTPRVLNQESNTMVPMASSCAGYKFNTKKPRSKVPMMFDGFISNTGKKYPVNLLKATPTAAIVPV